MSVRGKVFILILLVFGGSAGVIGGELHSYYKMQRYVTPQACADVPCPHLAVRLRAIESIIRQRGDTPSYLMIGDSITEFAELPEICGRKPINAGIGYATTKTFSTEGLRLAHLAKPDFIVVSLGFNDAFDNRADGFQQRLETILTSLRPWKVLLVPATPSKKRPDTDKVNSVIQSHQLPHARKIEYVDTTDGVHLSNSSYEVWKKNILDAAQASVCG